MSTKSILFISLILVWSYSGFAAENQYELRIDGLACPFCAYGIEKAFIRTDGVDSVEIDLKNGLVIVNTRKDKSFTEEQLKTIVKDTGFTMKSMIQKTR